LVPDAPPPIAKTLTDVTPAGAVHVEVEVNALVAPAGFVVVVLGALEEEVNDLVAAGGVGVAEPAYEITTNPAAPLPPR
jgi:hypothetical protein